MAAPVRLTAEQRAQLDAVPIPVEDGRPVAASVVAGSRGLWLIAWSFDGGRRKVPADTPLYPDARVAAAASLYLNQRGAYRP